jgi:hypothetical protein
MLHYLLELIIEIWQFEKIIIIQNFGEFGPLFPMKNSLNWWKSHFVRSNFWRKLANRKKAATYYSHL